LKENLGDFRQRHIRYSLMRTRMGLVMQIEKFIRHDGEFCYVVLFCVNGSV
jgi:hypothetical protein